MAFSADLGIAAIAVAPFAAAIVAPLLCRWLRSLAAPVLALVPLAILVYLCTLIEPIAGGAVLHARLDWVPSYGIDLAFSIDGLSLTFALLISGIGALVLLYSGAYLKDHAHLGRFLGFMLAFMGAMLGLVLADGLLVLYAFWELTTLTSFLLIGFDHTRQAARRAAVQALLVTSAGGLALLLGSIVLRAVTGVWDLSAMAGQGPALTGSIAYPLIFALFAAAAFTKSAQFPFHFWLPNAMEAPTPVSAFLHSATMVQGGVYLLARLSPLLGGTSLWSTTLLLFGGITLVWGSLGALRQTDLKQLLAHSTIASLGLLVLLLGIGGEAAVTAAIVYFLAHALYKAGLFLVAGLIDHETGMRDITVLGGLRDKMALSFIAAILAGFSMLGLPPALGYLAKEEIYLSLGPLHWEAVLVPLALVGGNAALGAVALALVARPFIGALVPTPKSPREGPLAMLIGPLLLGILGIAGAVLTAWISLQVVTPAVSAILGHSAAPHLAFSFNAADPAIWLSVLTWALSVALFWRLDDLRTLLRRLDAALGWSFDRVWDAGITALVIFSGAFARRWQSGRLRLYLLVLFIAMAAALLLPLLAGAPLALPSLSAVEPMEWGIVLLALAGLGVVLAARTLLVGILALGVQGLAIALLYLLFGAPDLSFTQFMVETLSVVMFALVMLRLKLDGHQRRSRPVAIRDAVLAVLGGGGVALVLMTILASPLDAKLPDFFERNAMALAHGRNIVNVILVDFRGLDTLGEIAVVITAGIAILALIATGRAAMRKPPLQLPPPAAGPEAAP